MARAKKESKPKKKKSKLLRLLVLAGIAGGVAYALSKARKPAAPCAIDPEDRLKVKDEENISGLGYIMKSLFGEFLKDPAKLAVLDSFNLSVAIEPVEQPETAITMTFAGGRILLEPGVVNPDIKIVCDYETLMQMAQMPAGLAAIKFMQTPEGKNIASKLMSGEMKIIGLPAHPIAMMKFSKFLSPS